MHFLLKPYLLFNKYSVCFDIQTIFTLLDKIDLIMKEYEKDIIVFPENVRVKIRKRIEDFLEKPKQKDFKFSKIPQRKNSNGIKFKITESTDTNENIKEEIKKINSDSFEVTTKLNFYKTKK